MCSNTQLISVNEIKAIDFIVSYAYLYRATVIKVYDLIIIGGIV